MKRCDVEGCTYSNRLGATSWVYHYASAHGAEFAPSPCEPCSYLGDTTPATSVTGWDFTPTCDFHAESSWSSRNPVAI